MAGKQFMHDMSKWRTELANGAINVKNQDDGIQYDFLYHFQGIQFKRFFTQFMTGFCQPGKWPPEIMAKTC
ncbi:MAG: hypothetical protein WDO71_28130 [Bacteroidota bacterium]